MSVNVGSAEGYIDLNTSGFSSGLANALMQLKEFQASAEATGAKLQDFGKSFSSIGEKMTLGVTAPLVAIGKSIMDTTSTFEAKMSSVKATLGAGTADMKQLHDEAIKLGADTAFSASEAAEGMENLASAGFNTQEIMGAMPGMLNLAAAGDLSIADASDIASSSLRGFGLAASDSTHVADVFAQVAADTNAQVSDLGEAMKYAAPVAHGFGLNIEETSAAIGEMANSGIKGSQAGTTLRTALTSLANPSKESAEAMKSIGFSAFDAQGKMLPLPQLIGNLQKSLSGLTQQQQEQKLATIFGTEALSGMQVLVEQGPDALKKEEDALKSCAGAAQQMGNTKMDNLKGSVEQLKGSMETFGISIGEIVTPALRKLIDSITDTVNSFNNMSNSQKTMVLSFAAVAASMGPHLVILGKLVESVGKFQSAIGSGASKVGEFGSKTLESFNKISLGFNALTTGTGKVARAFAEITMDSKLLGMMLQDGLAQKLSPLTSKMNTFASNLSSIVVGGFRKLPVEVQIPLEKLGTGISTVFGRLPAIITGPLAAFGGVVTNSLTSLMGVAMKIFLPAAIVAGLIAGLGLANQQFGTQIQNMINTATTEGPKIITNFANGITSKIPALMASGAAMLVELVGAINANLPAIVTGAVNILSALVNGLAANLPKLIPAALSLIQTIAMTILNNLPTIITAGLNLLVALAQGISNNSDKIVSVIVKILTTLITVIAQHLPQIIAAGIKILVALIQGLSQALPQLISYIPTIISAIRNAFTNVNWSSIGSNIIHGIVSGIEAVGSGIGNSLVSLAKSALGAAKAALGIHSPSKVFHDEVGIQIGAGISTGITDSIPSTVQAIAGYTDVLKSEFTNQLNNQGNFISNTAIMFSDTLKKATEREQEFASKVVNGVGHNQSTDSALTELQHDMDGLSVSTNNAQDDMRNMLGQMVDLSAAIKVADDAYLKLGNSIGWSDSKTQDYLSKVNEYEKSYIEMGQKVLEAQQKLRSNEFDTAYEQIDSKVKELTTDTKDNVISLNNQQLALQLLNQKSDELNQQYQELLNTYGQYSDEVKSAQKNIDDNNQSILEMKNTIQDTNEEISNNKFEEAYDKIDAKVKSLTEDTGNLSTNLVNQTQALQYLQWKAQGLDEQYYELVQTYGEFSDQAKEVSKNIQSNNQDIQDLNKSIDETNEKMQESSEETINTVADKVKDALKSYYEDMDKQQEDYWKTQIDNNNSWKDTVLKNLEDVYNSKKDELEREKTLLDRQNSDEDDNDKIAQDNQILSMNYSAKKKAEAQQDLDDTLKEMNRRHQKEQLDDQESTLETQYNKDKDNVDAIAQTNEDYYNNQINIVKSFYEEKEKDAQLDAETEQLMMSNSQSEVITLLKAYGKDYELAGGSIGEKFVKGFTDQMGSIKDVFDGLSGYIDRLQTKMSNLDTSNIDLATVGGSNPYTVSNSQSNSTSVSNMYKSLVNIEHMDASNQQDMNSLTQAIQFVVDQQSRAKGGSVT